MLTDKNKNFEPDFDVFGRLLIDFSCLNYNLQLCILNKIIILVIVYLYFIIFDRLIFVILISDISIASERTHVIFSLSTFAITSANGPE